MTICLINICMTSYKKIYDLKKIDQFMLTNT